MGYSEHAGVVVKIVPAISVSPPVIVEVASNPRPDAIACQSFVLTARNVPLVLALAAALYGQNGTIGRRVVQAATSGAGTIGNTLRDINYFWIEAIETTRKNHTCEYRK